MEPFRVRLNCIDHYQAIPSEFDPQLPHYDGLAPKTTRPKVPVIRVFGSTETGQKVCAHIHGAFPYLYIEYQGSLSPAEVSAAIRSLHLSIDRALAVSYRRNGYENSTTYVAHITLVKGIPFYGYYVGYRYFLKIYLLNPMNMTRLADLLRQGAVMKRPLQPYESHMQYLAQWMCDYNLYGCTYINCNRAVFRGPVPAYTAIHNVDQRWHDRSIPLEMVSDPTVRPKQSHCELEVDIHVRDILNRHEVRERPLHHDFIEGFQQESISEKLVPSLASLWEDEKQRRRKKQKLTDPDSTPFTPADLVSMSADPRNTTRGGWVHEEEYREHIMSIVNDESLKSDAQKPSFAALTQKNPFEATIKSALESVEDFFPENLQTGPSERPPTGNKSTEPPDADIQVDESRIQELGLDETFYGSDNSFSDALSEPEDSEDQLDSAEFHPADSLKEVSAARPTNGSLAQSLLADEREPANMAVDERPTTLPELENVGIRSCGNIINSQEDKFEIDDDFVSEVASRPGTAKRSTSSLGEIAGQNKRLKFAQSDSLAGFKTAQPDTNLTEHQEKIISENSSAKLELPSIIDDPSSQPQWSQKSAKSGTANQKIPFPVVKDPHDPATIARLSQQNGTIRKSQAESAQPFGSSSQRREHQGATNLSISSETDKLQASVSTPPDFVNVLHQAFGISKESRVYCFAPQCPSTSEIKDTISDDLRPSMIYRSPYYSNDEDVPDRAWEYAGREFKLESDTVSFLPPFDPTCTSLAMLGEKPPVVLYHLALEKENNKLRKSCSLRTWEFVLMPPSRAEVVEWLYEEQRKSNHDGNSAHSQARPIGRGLSQIDGPTQKGPYGFKYSQKRPSSNAQHETQYMSVMSLEVQVNTRGTLVPDPQEDEVSSIFWCVQSGETDPDDPASSEGLHVGILALSETSLARKVSRGVVDEFEEETTELDLLTKLVDIVRFHDPDILTGYEVHNGSWGYLIDRARRKYDYDLCDELSRVKTASHGRFGKENDRWGFNHTSTIRVTGRHMINIWRAMRGELNLLQYTMENVVFHLLHQRIPHYPFQDLTKLYKSEKPRDIAKVVSYFVSRVQLDLKILEANELISRTSEQARILGVDFFSVFSRGSQFKVESLMFRIAKPENFILLSPSKKQVGQQNALECLPLVMEPQSDFYTSPLLVLDFQSLYPSIMIAYNYCYSTCLGRVASWRGRNKMGVTEYKRLPRLLELLQDKINIAPNGMIYTKPEVRMSLLAKMLVEILETRVMVKGGMKEGKDDKHLQRLLNNRQLALKLIANVTYGYTSASFSGRMPCAEIADSIVQTARETLEKAIALIHSVERWGAEVVYGDTDSLFIHLKGRTRDEAFDIGEEIARTVTDSNPRPVKLKFEKVYHPCVLLAKKRYVGYKYESRSQKVPEFDAKGIETIRRDGTPAQQKIEEKVLKILFETADLSRVKSYFQKQCAKIMQGRVSVQDFCFAKEVRLGTYSDKGAPPPGALISAKRVLEDPRLEPQYGERVPYVVISGAPGARLIDRCVAPEVLLQDSQLELDAEYYISKNLIPPLERIFNLVGANVRQWYDEMPKYQRVRRIEATGHAVGRDNSMISKKTLESYMKSSSCVVCKEKLDSDLPVCNHCVQQAPVSLLDVRSRLLCAERKSANLQKICRSCMGVAWGEEVLCDSKDCPVFYSRTRQTSELRNRQTLLDSVAKILEDECDKGTLSCLICRSDFKRSRTPPRRLGQPVAIFRVANMPPSKMCNSVQGNFGKRTMTYQKWYQQSSESGDNFSHALLVWTPAHSAWSTHGIYRLMPKP
ncbi:hypothetical protein AJ80_01620 [Polytolypa hystricis UAMH7299]|uniref:DNA polymerase n=1 Tax=Polytolypa hystricis (strain UAMH7299) TaxID=1447883 RepID=A0A2B7YRN0_POLH7|nr:hypothetical protein AJ80_01620 [Polytolypa hystricis UAMH7299]